MNRGDLVTVALQGEHGKPRPALVIQSDLFANLTSTVTIALLQLCMVRHADALTEWTPRCVSSVSTLTD